MKPMLGVSIYPAYCPMDEVIDYLKLAKKYGFKKIFTSLFYLKKDDINKYIECFKIAKRMGFYIIADVGPESEKILNTIAKFPNLDIDCLRLDTPLPLKKVLLLLKKFDIQVNASYDTNLLDELINKGADKNKLSVMHNFYPRSFTGLSWSYFNRCNRKWTNLKIHNAAFVTSQIGTIGQQPPVGKQVKLPTLEKHRNLNIGEQTRQLIMSKALNDIFIGNYPASEKELQSVSKLTNLDDSITLKMIPHKITAAESKIVNYSNHFRRGDQSDGFIRSVEPRSHFKSLSIKPRVTKTTFAIGDVVIINNNDQRYKCELWIIQRARPKLDKDFNYIGHISKHDFWKLDLIDSWTKFKIIV